MWSVADFVTCTQKIQNQTTANQRHDTDLTMDWFLVKSEQVGQDI